MSAKKKSGANRLAVWIIVGLLMFGMIGFGAAGLNGTQRNLGKVGSKAVSISSYSNTLRGELNQFEQQIGRKLTVQEVQSIGIDQQALNRVINTRALDQLTSDLGLSVGDNHVLGQIMEIPAFMGLDGKFDRGSYTEVLKRNNLNEADFETSLREDSSRQLLERAILTGIELSPAYSKSIVSYISESRDFAWIRLSGTDLKVSPPDPNQSDLIQFHAENEAQFTAPATKSITYVWLTPDMIAKDIIVPEKTILENYENRLDEFNQQPSRLVERLVFANSKEAQSAFNELKEGTITFEEAVKRRGLELQDVDLGDVTEIDLGKAGTSVFSLTEPGLIGPLETELGPAIFRLNAILEANNQTFEMVKEQLRNEAALDAANEEIAAISEEVDDLLAGGATLEDVSKETDLELSAVDWYVGLTGGIADFEEFQNAAAEVTASNFPELTELDANSIFAIRLNSEREPFLKPLDTVKTAVSDAWTKKWQQSELKKLADSISRDVSLTNPLSSFGFNENKEVSISRDDFIASTPPALVSAAFSTEIGKGKVVEDSNGFIVLTPLAEYPADLKSDEVKSLQEIFAMRLNSALSQEIFQAFSNAVRNRVEVDINQATVNAVNSNILSGN
ncbi:MAG: SurA N-terminal domain-containing protein [Planktomarina sp.]|nr:SurA N-terminal domain-containing protein [Planktomarina sp.]